MTHTRDQLVQALWRGKDPFADFPPSLYKPDHQGWNSEHKYLTRAIDEAKPTIVIEIGVWKGGSVKTMAQHIKKTGVDAVVIAIDTWLGASDHWLRGEHDLMNFGEGYPRLYHTFAANMHDAKVQDVVLPLPLDSVNAFYLMQALNIRPDVLHIDAGHDVQSVLNDLRAWWPLLNDGGILVGDDYALPWAGVIEAFDTFFKQTPHALFESDHPKCFVKKSS